MTEDQKEGRRELIRRASCPLCHAQPDQLCTKGGRSPTATRRANHKERWIAACEQGLIDTPTSPRRRP